MSARKMLLSIVICTELMLPLCFRVTEKHDNEEQQYLAMVSDVLHSELGEIEAFLSTQSRDIQDNKEYLWENSAELDGAEKASVRQSISLSILAGESVLSKKRRLLKLISSPYFGRIDFRETPWQLLEWETGWRPLLWHPSWHWGQY